MSIKRCPLCVYNAVTVRQHQHQHQHQHGETWKRPHLLQAGPTTGEGPAQEDLAASANSGC